MLLRLVGIEGQKQGSELTLDQATLTIGRDSACGVVLADDEVSREHCRISVRGGGLVLEDLGSRRGTVLNGVLIQEPTPLDAGDLLLIGQELFEIRAGALPSQNIGATGPAPALPVQTGPSLLGAACTSSLPNIADSDPRVATAGELLQRGIQLRAMIGSALARLQVSQYPNSALLDAARRAVSSESTVRQSLSACLKAGNASDRQTAARILSNDLPAISQTLHMALDLISTEREKRGD